MSGYKSFAVVGGGTIGLPIPSALAAKNTSVIHLARPESADKTVPPGVQVVKVDFNNAGAVAAALKQHKVDVVLSTVNEAAKRAAVKLFVPSEYGTTTEGYTEGPLGFKNQLAESLKAIGIPSARFYTGCFAENIPRLVGYSDHGKIRILGTGEAPLSFTALGTLRVCVRVQSNEERFVAHVLTTLPPVELEKRIFRLKGDRTTLTGLGPLFKAWVEHLDEISGEPGKTKLPSLADRGALISGWNELKKAEGTGADAAGSANTLWPGHQWKTIKDVHNL
ncbi:hypothetical protein B0H13DRAFT_2230460 [Mycena leptocephala]|nr:hypothetical protein B0H13DRAFT_2230460 [Mycena leptocephala]